MMEKDLIKELNELEENKRAEKEAVYEKYGDHSDDAELCWEERRKEYDREIDLILYEAEVRGLEVSYCKETGKWEAEELFLKDSGTV